MDMKSLMPLLMSMNSGNQNSDNLQSIINAMGTKTDSDQTVESGNSDMMKMLPLLMNMMNNNAAASSQSQSAPPQPAAKNKAYERFSPIENFSGKEINLGLYNLMKNI